MTTLANMTTKQAIRYAKRQARSCFAGIAIPTPVTISEVNDDLSNDLRFLMVADRIEVDGETMMRGEKVLPFNRRKLLADEKKPKKKGHAADRSMIRVGQPGDRERLEAYAAYYQGNGCTERGYEGSISPFVGED